MERGAAVTVVGGLVAATGVALLAVAWAIGSVAWSLADLPGADNDVLRELVLGAAGTAFLAVAGVGSALGLNRSPGRVPARRAAGAASLALLALVVALLGAGRHAASSAAAVLTPALDDAAWSSTPVTGGLVLVGVALVLAAAGLAVLLLPVGRDRGTPATTSAVGAPARDAIG